MSRVIFEGDTISRFGKKIPTPFIDKIELYDSFYRPTVTIYLHITDDDDTNQAIYEDLQNLKFYYGFGTVRENPLDLNTSRISTGENFQLVDERIYNSQGARFAKFTFSKEVNYQQEFTLERALTDAFNRDTYFSCFIAVEDDEAGTRNSNLLENAADDQQIKQFDRRGTYNIYRNVSSPLVYEKVFTAPFDGSDSRNRVADDDYIVYVDAQGIPCESTPLYSIQKNYYKTTDSFREQLKTEIDDLVSSYGTTSDQQLESFLDSISFIAQTKNRDVDFITELDKVRNSFPSRTSTSNLGTLYNRLKDILFAANDALILGTQLQKRIVPNTKIVNYLGSGIDQDFASWTIQNPLTYAPRPDNTGKILYSTFFMERIELEIDKVSSRTGNVYDKGTIREPNYDIVRNFGYFFYDYEKALHFKSNISQIYKVEKLLELFGNNSLDSFFQLNNTSLKRFANNRDRVSDIRTDYGSNGLRVRFITDGHTGNAYNLPDGGKVRLKEGRFRIERDYVILRKFDTYRGLDGYRLLAFEFQDFQPSAAATDAGQSYEFEVVVNDNTIDFYDAIKESFKRQIDRLKKYVEFAEDFCSYNNIDGRFNDFFIEKIREKFPRDFPWRSAAQHYALHLHLLEDSFGETRSLMLMFAEKFSVYLTPETTTLEVLINKAQEIIDFYEKYYGDEGSITTELVPLTPASGGGTTAITSLRDNIKFICTKNYSDFPDVHDLTPDPSEPVAFTAWNGNVIDWNDQIARDFIKRKTMQLVLARANNSETLDDYLADEAARDESNMVGFGEDTSNSLEPDFERAFQRTGGLGHGAYRRRARRMFTFIYKIVRAIQAAESSPAARDEFPFNARKEGSRELLYSAANAGVDEGDLYKYIKNWNDDDRDFVLANIPVFGNIALHVIKSSRTGTLDCYDVLNRMRRRNEIQLSRNGEMVWRSPLDFVAKSSFGYLDDYDAEEQTGITRSGD